MTERGSAPIELALGVLALLIPVSLMVLSFAPVLAARALVRSLAVDAARAIVLTEGDAAAAWERMAWRVGERAAADHLRVGPCGEPLRPLSDLPDRCDLERSSHVEVTVELAVSVVLLPGSPTSVSYTHVEPVDPYRSRG